MENNMNISPEELEKMLEKAKADLQAKLDKMTPEERAQAELKAQKLIAEDKAAMQKLTEDAAKYAAAPCAKPTPKFCPNCGAKAGAGNFCEYCGSKLCKTGD